MLRLRDIMTAPVLTVDPEMSIRDAMELLTSHHVTGAPVVSGGRIVGAVSATDLLAFVAQLPGIPPLRNYDEGVESASGRTDTNEPSDESAVPFFVDIWRDCEDDVSARYAATESPEWSQLEEHTVSEAMTDAPLHILPPGATVRAAAECMRSASVHRVFVAENDRLVGIVTSSDIAAVAAQTGFVTKAYQFGAHSRGYTDG